MTPDKSKDGNSRDFMAPAKRRGGRLVLFAGVAGACALGVGLGLWARPAVSERKMAVAAPGGVAKAAAPTRKIQIVVDDSPAPIGALIEVLAGAKAAPVAPHATPAPVGPPRGLMLVQSITPPAPAPSPPKPAPAKAKVKATPPLAAPKLVLAKAKPTAAPARLAPAHLAQIHIAPFHSPPAHVAPVHLAKAAPPPAKSRKIELARAAQARAEAAKAKAEARRIELAKAAKAEKQEQLRLAKAEAKGRAEARAEAKAEALAQARMLAQEETRRRIRLASLAHAVPRPPPRILPHAAPHAAKLAPAVELARLDRRPGRKVRRDGQVEQAAARKPPRPAEPTYRAHAGQFAPLPHPGLMKVSDPSLGAAERQLARAYQGARAAGVPDAQLQRQQQRWLAARSAAAREAPWAVHDVYLARIAELNGMAKDAHGDGY
jgi:hypothetical protein